jgi:hypothetical protein
LGIVVLREISTLTMSPSVSIPRERGQHPAAACDRCRRPGCEPDRGAQRHHLIGVDLAVRGVPKSASTRCAPAAPAWSPHEHHLVDLRGREPRVSELPGTTGASEPRTAR